MPDDTPAKLGLAWAVAPGKTFAASRALERLAETPPDRRLVGLAFDREARSSAGSRCAPAGASSGG